MTQKVTRLDQMNLVDKFLFDEVMEDVEVYEAMISILMEKRIFLLSQVETEKEFRISPELREIRLDVISMDIAKTLYFTEMQKRNTNNLEKRSRYYQSLVDVSLLPPGEKDFNKLKDTCLILIAPFDIFGRDLYRYTFIGTCQECPELKLNDGAVRIFINTKGKNKADFSQEFLDLMDYITESTDEVAERSKSHRIKQMHKRVKEVKQAEKMGVKAMQRWEEEAWIREDGLLEGLEKGRKMGALDMLIELVHKGKLTHKEAAGYVNMSEEDFKKRMEFEVTLDNI